MAAAKFKKLRSNTLAAAFGVGEPSTISSDSNNNNNNTDLLAVRTRDERIVNTLTPANRTGRFELN